MLFFLTLSPRCEDEKESHYFVIIIALTWGMHLRPELLKYFQMDNHKKYREAILLRHKGFLRKSPDQMV